MRRILLLLKKPELIFWCLILMASLAGAVVLWIVCFQPYNLKLVPQTPA